jgi:hypothetical protein
MVTNLHPCSFFETVFVGAFGRTTAEESSPFLVMVTANVVLSTMACPRHKMALSYWGCPSVSINNADNNNNNNNSIKLFLASLPPTAKWDLQPEIIRWTQFPSFRKQSY